ncbi:type IV pilin protein [Agrilutibacter solisilvae]|uniref:type IV pilin protein n=1 Tax=Agrilutibacter solisilvae TaxID=2763317 RepID=UPI002545C364|nr:type IV pilin protein [Lysobacter solisilvae]
MRQKGFTLIELMIVVIVVAILAAIAIPSYLEQSRKGRRADALEAIGRIQLGLERWRAENPSYAQCGTCTSGAYPTIGNTAFYNINVAAGATTYTITATPTGKQAGDRCGNLVVSQISKPDWSGDLDCDN